MVGMIKKINFRLRESLNKGIFHDSREDSRRLAKTCNILIDKVNELTDEVNKLNKVIRNERANK